MKLRQLLSALGIAFVLVAAGRAQDNQPAKGDPLPEGARARIGGGGLTLRVAGSYTLLPPDYNLVMLPDTATQFGLYDLKAWKYSTEKGPVAPPGGPVHVSDDGTRMVLASHRPTVPPQNEPLLVRDAKTGKPICECLYPKEFLPTATPGAVSLAGNGKVLAQWGRVGTGKDAKMQVFLWDLEKADKDGKVTATALAPAHTVPVQPVLSPDGKLLATISGSPGITPKEGSPEDELRRTIQVWDVATKKELFKARVASEYVWPVCAFSPDGALLAVASYGPRIDLWDVKTGKLKSTLTAAAGQGRDVAFSPDGKSVAAVSYNGTIERWATADGKRIDTTPPPTGLPVSLIGIRLAFASNDRVVAWALTGSTTPAIMVWEAPSGKFLTNSTGHAGAIHSLAFTDDGKHFISSSQDRRFLKWDAATGKLVGSVTFKPSKGRPQPAAATLSHDGKRAWSGSVPGFVYDLTTGEELFELPRPTGSASTWLSADGKHVLVFVGPPPGNPKKSSTGTAQVWNVAAKKKTAEVEVSFDSPGLAAASLSPSGDRLVVARVLKRENAVRPVLTVTGWDLKTGKKLGEIEDINAEGQFRVTALSERTVVVSSWNGWVRLFDYELGRGSEELEPKGTARPGMSATVLSPNGKRFAYGLPTKDPTVFGVRVHDWPSGKVLHTFSGHMRPVTALAFSPDGKTLATGSLDGTIILWDLTKIGPK
jgi:WD40 repeat protein